MRLTKLCRFWLYVLAIGMVRSHLRLFGFRRTLDRARAIAASFVQQPVDRDAIHDANELARLVESAAAIYPGRARCLEQSLCLYLLLRRRGVPANIRIGARALPFAAHAWVEVAGECINTEADILATFQVFPDLGA